MAGVAGTSRAINSARPTDRTDGTQTGVLPKASDNDSLTADFTGDEAIFRVVRVRTSRACLFFPADFFPFSELACIMLWGGGHREGRGFHSSDQS